MQPSQRPPLPVINEVRPPSRPLPAKKEASHPPQSTASAGTYRFWFLLRHNHLAQVVFLMMCASFITGIILGIVQLVSYLQCRSELSQPSIYEVTQVGDYYEVTCEWTYKGRRYNYELCIPKENYEWCKSANSNWRRITVRTGDFSYYVESAAEEENMKRLAGFLGKTAQEKGWDEFETVGFLLSFVQAMPYTSDKVTTGYDEYPRYPTETMVDGGGDCEDTSILFASLVRGMGYDVVLLNPPGHMAVGFPVSDSIISNWPNRHHGDSLAYYTTDDGRHWAYCETTGEGWVVGGIPEEYAGSSVRILEVSKDPGIAPFPYQIVSQGTIAVDAGSYKESSFDVDTGLMTDTRLLGRVVASTAGGTVEVLLMDDIGFNNWKIGRKYSGVGYVAKAPGVDFVFDISTSGRYHLVYNNTSAPVSSVNLDTYVFLLWDKQA